MSVILKANEQQHSLRPSLPCATPARLVACTATGASWNWEIHGCRRKHKLQQNYRYIFETNTDSEKGDQKFCQRIEKYVFKWSACRDSHTYKVADGIKFLIRVLQDHSQSSPCPSHSPPINTIHF